MSRKILSTILIPGALLLAAGCAQQAQQGEGAPAADQAAGSAMQEAASAVADMTPEKVQEIAQIVVHLAQNPEKATEILAEHGMTQEQVDAAVAKIQANPEMNSMFEAAKTSAQSMMEGAGQAMDQAGEAAQGVADQAHDAAQGATDQAQGAAGAGH